MTPQAGQVRDTQSTQAKDGHYKGKVLSSSATSCRLPPSSFNSTDTSPSHALCGALAITDHQGSAWGPRTLRSRRKTTYPPTAPTALLSLNLLGQLPQGREVQSDGAGKEHRSRSRWARALPLHPDTRNSKQPQQSWKRRVQLEDSHFLTEDNAAETQCGAGLKADIQTNRTERRAQKLTFA